MSSPTPPLTPLAAAVLEVGTPESVLELQCGEGDGSLFLAREFPRARVRGVDRSAEAVRQAVARVGLDPEGRVAFKVGTPRSLPFPDDHFDLVAGLDVSPAAGEVARVLRPGGYLALAYSGRATTPRGLRARLVRWRLSRRGFTSVRADRAGDGSFSVGRLKTSGRRPRAL
jgi:ubiquinone/menaquinone biosynthesis C-methylase UbiE